MASIAVVLLRRWLGWSGSMQYVISCQVLQYNEGWNNSLCTLIFCFDIFRRRMHKAIIRKVWKWFVRPKTCCLNCPVRSVLLCHFYINLSTQLKYTVQCESAQKNETVDLGIMDSKLRLDKHISLMVNKAHARPALIRRCFRSKDLLFRPGLLQFS